MILNACFNELTVFQNFIGSASENENQEILWEFSTQTDHVMKARWLDMFIVDKKNNKCQIIDFAVPFETRVGE